MSLKDFENQQYLNLETFRKNGQGVRTPVWFAQDEGFVYIWTEADSGKAKRVRHNAQVTIAPSRGDGVLLGNWHSATVTCDDSPEAVQKVRRLFVKKYGLLFHAFALLGKLRKAKYTTLKIDFGN